MKASHWSMLSSSTAARKDMPCTCSPGERRGEVCQERSSSVVGGITTQRRLVVTHISHIGSVAGICAKYIVQLLVHDASLWGGAEQEGCGEGFRGRVGMES